MPYFTWILSYTVPSYSSGYNDFMEKIDQQYNDIVKLYEEI